MKAENNQQIISTNKRHAIVCRYLLSDKSHFDIVEDDWDAYKEYCFLRNEFSLNSYSKARLKKILKYYYSHCVYIFRYDLFYAAAFAAYDYLNNVQLTEDYDLFIKSLVPDLRSPNELDTFYDEQLWKFSQMKRSKLYRFIQLFTENGKGIKNNKYSVIDLSYPTLGSSYGAKKILFWDKKRLLGYVSYRDETLFKSCKKMISESLKANNQKLLLDLLYIKDKILLDDIKRHRQLNICEPENKIVFYVGTRLGVCDNPKYVLLASLNDNELRKYRMVWIAYKPEMCDEIRDIANVIPLEDNESVLHELKTAKVIIYNDDLPATFVPNNKQALINVWHGAINYKKIGFDSYEFKFNKYKSELFALANPKPDVFVAGSKSFLDTAQPAFKFDKAIFADTGLPRNDILFHNNFLLVNSLKQKLDIPTDKKVALYAPTWRKGNRADLHNIDINLVLESLKTKFGGDWVFLYRGHTFTTTFWNGVENSIDVSNYPDSHEILLISDVLISDYSSFIYDAALISKPVFIYAPDIAEYKNNERGFYIQPNEWPFSISETNEDLRTAILSFDDATYKSKIAEHLKTTGSFDKGNASIKLIEIIKKVLKSK